MKIETISFAVMANTCFNSINTSVKMKLDVNLESIDWDEDSEIIDMKIKKLIEAQHPDVYKKAEEKLRTAMEIARAGLPDDIDSDLLRVAKNFAEQAEIYNIDF